MLKVQRSVFAHRDRIPVQIVIIQAHQNRLLPVDSQLGGKTVRRGSLTGRAGTRQHHRFGSALADRVCNL